MIKKFIKKSTLIIMVALLSSISLCGCNNSENEESSNVSDTSLVSDVSAEVKVSIGGIEEDTENSEALVSVPTDDDKLNSDIEETSRLLNEVTKLGSKGEKFFNILDNGNYTIQIDEETLFGDKVTYFITCDNDNYYIEDCNNRECMLYTGKKQYIILEDTKEIVDIDGNNILLSPADLLPEYNGFTFKGSKLEEYEGVQYNCETYITNDALYTDEKRTQLGVQEVGTLKFYFDGDEPCIMVYTYENYEGSTVVNISKFSNKADKSYFKVPNYTHISISEYEKR